MVFLVFFSPSLLDKMPGAIKIFLKTGYFWFKARRTIISY